MQSPKPSLIKETRQRADQTQTEAAESIGYKMRTWQDWEAGKFKMKPVLWESYLSKIKTLTKGESNGTES